MSTDLIVFEELDPVLIFKKGGAVELIKNVTAIVESHVNDVTTPEGQANIRSLAYTIAQTKTAAVKFGKKFISSKDQEVKDFKKEIKSLESSLGELQANTREPLTDWENTEKQRVEDIKREIVVFRALSDLVEIKSSKNLKRNLHELKETEITEEAFAEFTSEATVEKDMAVKKLERAIEDAEKREAEAAELEKLRKEKEEREANEAAEKAKREQEERDARIAREAEEKAKREAEQKAKEEAERVEHEKEEAEAEIARQKQAVIDAEKEAERKAVEAKAEADLLVKEAAQRERDRIEAERKSEEAATKKREADKAYKARINNAAKTAIEACGVDCKQAKAIVKAIATGKIPQVSIRY